MSLSTCENALQKSLLVITSFNPSGFFKVRYYIILKRLVFVDVLLIAKIAVKGDFVETLSGDR